MLQMSTNMSSIDSVLREIALVLNCEKIVSVLNFCKPNVNREFMLLNFSVDISCYNIPS